MNTAHTTAYNVLQKTGRLNREIVHYAKRVTSIGDARTPQEKRAMTLAMKCLKRSVRELDNLKTAS
jgi:hypothetical protein